MLVLLALMMVLIQAESERPPRPTDDVLLAAVRSDNPAAEILSHSARDARDGARVICGTARVNGQVEPFHALAIWDRSGGLANVIVNGDTGQPLRPAEPDHWKVSAVLPEHQDDDGDGVQTRYERNIDALDRKLTLQVCRDLTPPERTVWTTEIERNPDPAQPRER